jgi:hypothetical protein
MSQWRSTKAKLTKGESNYWNVSYYSSPLSKKGDALRPEGILMGRLGGLGGEFAILDIDDLVGNIHNSGVVGDH